MKKRFIFSLFSLLFANMQAQEVLTPEKLWALGRVAIEDVSPRGDLILYSVTRFDVSKNKGNSDLFIISPNRPGEPKQVTNTEESESNARFMPDGQRIACLKDGKWVSFFLDGNKIEEISKDEVGGFEFSPNGKRVMSIMDVKYGKETADLYPDFPLSKARVIEGLMYRHWKTWDDHRNSNVFFQDFAEGKIISPALNIMNEAFDSPLMPDGGMEELAWSMNGEKIAYTCKKLSGTAAALSTNSDIYLYNIADKSTINVSEKNLGYDKEPTFSPDGKYMTWNSMATPGFEADKNRLILMDLATGKQEDVTLGWDNSVAAVKWAKDSKRIYFIGGDKGTKQIFYYDMDSKKITQLTKGQFDYVNFAVADKNLVAARQSMSYPTELFLVSAETGEAKQLTKINDDILGKLTLGKVESRSVKTTDGKDMLVWMIYPPNFDKNKKYPTLLYCQGGPQSAVSQFWSYRWNMQMMAANGYIVVAPCRRGMPTFGQAWNDQISKDWGGQCMKDYLSAIDDAKKEPYVNVDKLGAVGASFGGYSVYWLAGNHEKRFKAFISHCGMFNVESWYGTTEEMFFANYDLGKTYWEDPKSKAYNEFSPINHVSKWDTPILIFHGELDYRVPLSEGLQAFQAAQLKGIPSKMVTFPDEGHQIGKPQNGLIWQKEFFAWLDKYLK